MYTPGALILDNRYRIERELGHGAFGVVYLATHRTLGVQHALKVLHHDGDGVGSTVLGDYRSRFTLEAQLAARLTHPHVIQVYDFVEWQDALHCVMEYAPGGSLGDLLAKGPLPVERVRTLIEQCCLGLEAIHDRLDAVHRDVKPANLLLDAEGHVKVADLGLAQVGGMGISRRSQLGSIAIDHPGTPDYNSPEHSNGAEPLAPTADVYALGCVAFELLTGMRWKAARRKARKPSDLRAEVPAWLDAVVVRMINSEPGLDIDDATNPAKRFVDCGGVREALVAPARAEAAARAAAEERKVRAAALASQAAEALKRKEYAEAIRAYSEAVELDPQNAAFLAGRGEALNEAAEARHASGDFGRALADLTRAIELDPANARYFYLRGEVYNDAAFAGSAHGDFGKALADHSRAIELAPGIGLYYGGRGHCYSTAATLKHSLGDLDKALADLNRGVELDPGSATVVLRRGIAHRYRGEHAEAIADKSRAIELEPQDAGFYYSRGLSLSEAADAKHPAGDYGKAIADYTRAIELSPARADYYSGRALSYHSAAFYEHPSGDYNKAIADYTRAIELAPNDAAHYNCRSISFYNVDHSAEAIADAEAAARLDPLNTSYRERLWRLRIELLKADYNKADSVEAYSAVIAQAEALLANRDLPGADRSTVQQYAALAYSRRSVKHYHAGDFGKDIADSTRAIELDPTNAAYYYSRGVSYKVAADAGNPASDYGKAIADYTRAIELDPNDATYVFDRGRCFNNAANAKHPAGDYARAIADKTRAIELAPDKASYYDSRGHTFHEAAFFKHPAGDYARAIADHSKAIELEPDNATYYSNRSSSFYNVDRNAEALADAETAARLDPQNTEYGERAERLRIEFGQEKAADVDTVEAWTEAIAKAEAMLADRTLTGSDRSRVEALAARAYSRRSVKYYDAGDYARDIADSTRAIELAPNNASYYNSRGCSYHQAAYSKHPAGDYNRAIADKTRAIELEPSDADYYHSRSITYYNVDRNAEALADAETAARLDPQNAEYRERLWRLRLGQIESDADRANTVESWSAAIAKAEALLARSDLSGSERNAVQELAARAYSRRSVRHFRAGDYDKDLADSTRAIELAPNRAAYYNSRGNTYHAAAFSKHPAGDYARAISDFTRAIGLAPDVADQYDNRGRSYHEAACAKLPYGDFSKAIADFTRAIELDPGNAVYYNRRGSSYHQAAYIGNPAGDYAKAIADKTRAIQLDPSNAVYYNSRSISYYNADRNEQALADAETAARLDPQNAAYRERLERLRREAR